MTLGHGAYAKDMNLVIDLNGVVFTQIPYSKDAHYGKEVIQFGRNKRQKRKNSFVRTPMVQAFFESLGQYDNLKIHFVNAFPGNQDVTAILGQITLDGLKVSTLSQLSTSIIKTKKLDLESLKDIDPTLESIFYLASKEKNVPEEIKGQSLIVDNNKVLFLNFADSQKSLKELKDFPKLFKKLKEHLPGNKEAWEESYYRLARPVLILNQLLKNSHKGFDLTKRKNSYDSNALEIGMKILDKKFFPIAPKWKLSSQNGKEKVQCVKYDFLNEEEVAKLSLDQCLSNFHNWGYFYTDNKLTTCSLFVSEKDAVYEEGSRPLKDCKGKRVLLRSSDRKKYGILSTTTRVQNMGHQEALEVALKSTSRFMASPKETFGEILLADSGNEKLIKHFGGSGSVCVDALQKFYMNGNLLRSQAIESKLIPLKDYKTRVGINNDFFHYTNAHQLYTLLMPEEQDRNKVHEALYSKGNEGYGSILYFLKSKGNPSYDDLYLAQDPYSSKHYGSIQLKFYLSDEAMVFDNHGTILQNWSHMREVRDELSLEYPELYQACSAYTNSLYYLALDDSGADILDYYDVNKWFKITNSSIITGCEVRQF